MRFCSAWEGCYDRQALMQKVLFQSPQNYFRTLAFWGVLLGICLANTGIVFSSYLLQTEPLAIQKTGGVLDDLPSAKLVVSGAKETQPTISAPTSYSKRASLRAALLPSIQTILLAYATNCISSRGMNLCWDAPCSRPPDRAPPRRTLFLC